MNVRDLTRNVPGTRPGTFHVRGDALTPGRSEQATDRAMPRKKRTIDEARKAHDDAFRALQAAVDDTDSPDASTRIRAAAKREQRAHDALEAAKRDEAGDARPVPAKRRRAGKP